MNPNNRIAVLTVALLASVLAAGCDKTTSTGETVGQKIDKTIDSANDRFDATASRIERKVESAGTALTGAADKVQDKASVVATLVSDSAITASIKTDLLKDPHLSALRIDVNTVKGVVTLKGEVGSEASKQRAVQMASAIAGVERVDDQLELKGPAGSTVARQGDKPQQ